MQSLQKVPPLLPYAPLLQLLPDIQDGDSVLKDVRSACMASAAGTITRMMQDAAGAIEKLMLSGADREGEFPVANSDKQYLDQFKFKFKFKFEFIFFLFSKCFCSPLPLPSKITRSTAFVIYPIPLFSHVKGSAASNDSQSIADSCTL
jgi:hypothetical protein